ncbi:unnamed protein product [Adineta ricciae]|uniref:Uncharacterized protein n=1 Tax=Adineta ricciae TaxID=249248 RepID=A0A815W1F8_ADIRI|nr:unnamed protein product [Adineta ricciae]CAF1542155.1 unnamed protein product [Adineta ricciae]
MGPKCQTITHKCNCCRKAGFYRHVKVLRILPSELNEMLLSVKRKDLCLVTKDDRILKEFLSLLTLFAEATTITQAEHTSSISLFRPTVLAIRFDLMNEQLNVTYTSSLCSTLLNSLISRFGGLLEALGVTMDKSIQRKKSLMNCVATKYLFIRHFWIASSNYFGLLSYIHPQRPNQQYVEN